MIYRVGITVECVTDQPSHMRAIDEMLEAVKELLPPEDPLASGHIRDVYASDCIAEGDITCL